jgi:hypothetical protein
MLMIECYQKLSTWLCSSTNRASRAYLETHLDLLTGEIERFLELFIGEHSDSPAEQQRLRTMQALLQDTRARGGTRQSVRDAYVNVFGGMILDLPSCLLEIEHRLTVVSSPLWTERMVTICKLQLRDAIDYTSTDSQIAPEIGAELQYQLGRLFVNKSAHAPANVYDMVVDSYHACLQVYTAERYPRQFQKVQAALAEVSSTLSSFIEPSPLSF